MDILKFTEKTSFPLASTWLDKQYQITSQLADSIAKMVMQDSRYVGKQAVIFSGCNVNSNVVSAGYIVFNGTLYQFKQSNVATYLVLKKQVSTIVVGNETYAPYENWWLELSNSNAGADVVSSVTWSSAVRFSTLPNVLTIQLNGTTITYDGSQAKTINLDAAANVGWYDIPVKLSKPYNGLKGYDLSVRRVADKYIRLEGQILMNYDLFAVGQDYEYITIDDMPYCFFEREQGVNVTELMVVSSVRGSDYNNNHINLTTSTKVIPDEDRLFIQPTVIPISMGATERCVLYVYLSHNIRIF
jgi:hypothetical protein